MPYSQKKRRIVNLYMMTLKDVLGNSTHISKRQHLTTSTAYLYNLNSKGTYYNPTTYFLHTQKEVIDRYSCSPT